MFQFIKHKRENILNLLSIKAKIKYERVCKHIINFSVLVIYIFYIFDLAQRYKGLMEVGGEVSLRETRFTGTYKKKGQFWNISKIRSVNSKRQEVTI